MHIVTASEAFNCKCPYSDHPEARNVDELYGTPIGSLVGVLIFDRFDESIDLRFNLTFLVRASQWVNRLGMRRRRSHHHEGEERDMSDARN